jgi:hypothetical protein
MKNLATHEMDDKVANDHNHLRIDHEVETELLRCGIEVVHGDRSKGEVPASITGRLGSFTFSRAWYYWVVSGNVPLEVAKELFADVVGATDIRVNRNCTCPAPEGYNIEWLSLDARKVASLEDKKKFAEWAAKEADSPFKVIGEDGLKIYEFSDDPASIGAKAYITSYHIDSELGLRIFADTIKKHGLNIEKGPQVEP